jgi:hypothetical protein
MNGLNGTASLHGGAVWAAGETDAGTLVIETANG